MRLPEGEKRWKNSESRYSKARYSFRQKMKTISASYLIPIQVKHLPYSTNKTAARTYTWRTFAENSQTSRAARLSRQKKLAMRTARRFTMTRKTTRGHSIGSPRQRGQ